MDILIAYSRYSIPHNNTMRCIPSTSQDSHSSLPLPTQFAVLPSSELQNVTRYGHTLYTRDNGRPTCAPRFPILSLCSLLFPTLNVFTGGETTMCFISLRCCYCYPLQRALLFILSLTNRQSITYNSGYSSQYVLFYNTSSMCWTHRSPTTGEGMDRHHLPERTVTDSPGQQRHPVRSAA